MNHNSRSEATRPPGVDITAGYRAVELMKAIARTMTAGVCSGHRRLRRSALSFNTGLPVTDGVGTKLKLAFLMDKHDNRRHRLRGHVRQRHHLLRREAPAVSGLHRLRQERARAHRRIVSSVAEGSCVQSGAALIGGGETAECRASTPPDSTTSRACRDVDKAKDPEPGATMHPGDVVIALPSSGVHSMAFSLVRKVF